MGKYWRISAQVWNTKIRNRRMPTVHPNDVLLVKKGRFLARKRCSYLNMESKGIQNRKAARDREASIYTSAIISAL